MKDRLKRHQLALVVMVSGITAALLLAGAVWAYDSAQRDQIAPGVSIGGVDVGGRSADDARRLVQKEIADPLNKAVVVNYDGETFKLTPRALKHEADVDGMVDEAVEVSRNGGLVERVGRYVSGSEVNVDVAPRVGYSDKAIENFVADVAGKVNQEAQNASIVPNGDSIRPTPGQKGIEVQEPELQDAIREEVEQPGVGDEIDVPTKHTQPEITRAELAEEYPTYITVDRAAFKVRLFKNLKLAKSYTVAIGAAGYDTPTGLYSIQSKEVNPTWHVPDSEWAGDLAGQDIPPGPGNPLVARWMGIYNGAGFHGTDDIGSLGSAASHGCIRMAVPDVIDLFDRVEVGDPVYIQ
jgi:lipoprotein-anchoring transpeptidase ErfK/SrfK